MPAPRSGCGSFGTRVETLWSLIGDAPEAIEASLLQAYAPRDPVREYLTAKVTARQLRVMIEHLPPDAPWHRARYADAHDGATWVPPEVLMLWHVESRLRDLAVQQANLWRKEGTEPAKAEYMRQPGARDDEPDREVLDMERAELSALWHR